MRSFHIGKEIKGVLQGFRTRVILQRRVCCFQGVGPLGAAFSSGSWGRFYSREGLSCSWSNHRQTSIVSGDEDDAFAIRALLQHGPQPSPRRRRSRSLRAQRLQSRIPTHPSGLTLHPFPRVLPSEPKRPSDLPSVCPQLPVSDPPLCLARRPHRPGHRTAGGTCHGVGSVDPGPARSGGRAVSASLSSNPP